MLLAAVGSRHSAVGTIGWMRVCLAVFNLVDPECDRSGGEGEENLKNASGVERDVLSDFGPAAGWRKGLGAKAMETDRGS
jgi:hypothetical protein